MAEPPKPSQTPLPQEENKIENETPPPPVEKIISPDLDYDSFLKKYVEKTISSDLDYDSFSKKYEKKEGRFFGK